MTQLEIVPHLGIGPIHFGVPRDEVGLIVESVLGLSYTSRTDEIDYFDDGSLGIEYWSDSTVSFVWTSYSRNLSTLYRGVNVFDMASSDLYTLVAEREQKRPAPYSDDEVLLPEQALALWNAGIEYDYFGNSNRKVFAAVGIGDHRYVRAVLDRS